ncbi:MAG: accessory gene regulator B family protein [Ruminococcus flavefaciens]|nr:accessory gene regulator B family protein [Ruminococcus flavefaciens]
MIEKMSGAIVNYMLKCEVISNTKEDMEYYQYGVEITVSSIINVLLILFIGLVFGNLIESVLFLLLFIPIRQYTGGYHANTYFKCNLTFAVLFAILLFFYRFTGEILTSYFSILIVYVCVLTIVFMCPIENPNKPIPKEKRKGHKIMAITLGTIYGITGVVLVVFANKYGALILYTLLQVTLLVLAAFLPKRRCKYESNKKGNQNCNHH